MKALSELKARQFVLDGEIAVPEGRYFSFDALLQRIHPAASRVARLARQTPAILVVFDLLDAEPAQRRRDKHFDASKSLAAQSSVIGPTNLCPTCDKLRGQNPPTAI